MSRTNRSPDVLNSYWSYKSNSKRDFQAKQDKDYQGDQLGFRPKPRPLQNAWDDKVPSAVLETRSSLWRRKHTQLSRFNRWDL
jgi:hypothetical protein